jgi:anti-sigma B factor antagonist
MSTQPFSASIRDGAGSTIIDLHGEVNATAMEGLDTAYGEVTAPGNVILNFSDVSYINSSGIAVIVSMLARARTDGRTVTAYGLSDHYEQIFRITRIAEYIAMFPDEPSALAGAGT